MADIELFTHTGQSLDLAADGGNPYTTFSTVSEVANGHRVKDNGTYEALEAEVTGSNVEHQLPMFSMGYRLSQARPLQEFAFAINARGGKTLLELSKGGSTGVYEDAITKLTNFKAVSLGLGKSVHCAGLHLIQGEADQFGGTTSFENYLIYLDQYMANYNADVKAITGQIDDIHLVMSQTATWNWAPHAPARIGLAQLEAHRTRPHMWIVGGQYQFAPATTDPVTGLLNNPHFRGPHGYYWLGELHARARQSIIDTGSWEPVSPFSIIASGTTITVLFHCPVAPLVFDTTWLAAQPNMGFSLDSKIAVITDVHVSGSQVTITTDVEVEPDAMLGYAVALDPRSNLGNLRDSQSTLSAYDGSPLPNWCVQFLDPIIGGTGTPPDPPTIGLLFTIVSMWKAYNGGWYPLFADRRLPAEFWSSDFGDAPFL